MNTQAFEAGKVAYQQGMWSQAVASLSQAKQPGEVCGSVDHLLGNALMKLGRYDEASAVYESALKDVSYGKVGALSCNRGRALSCAGRYQEAVQALNMTLSDASYPTPYKANIALGNAQLALGDARSAGVAYRNAAIDETNPEPSKALVSLGNCFLQLTRPLDAIEAFRTALDFSAPTEDQAPIYAQLGDAYCAANRMNEAVDAYTQATSGSLTLSPAQQASFEAAQRALSAIAARKPSETDDLLAAAGYGPNSSGTYDPLDPLGKSGELMPSPEDTGFFTISEEDIVSLDAAQGGRKKHSHRVLKFFMIILVLLLIVAGCAGFAYYKGYGWPTQETVVESFFAAGPNGNFGSYLDANVSSDMRDQIALILPEGATITVDGIDRDMSNSTVSVVAQLAEGGEQPYRITLIRNGISWKITSVELVYDSQGDGATSLGALTGSDEGTAEETQSNATTSTEGTVS